MIPTEGKYFKNILKNLLFGAQKIEKMTAKGFIGAVFNYFLNMILISTMKNIKNYG